MLACFLSYILAVPEIYFDPTSYTVREDDGNVMIEIRTNRVGPELDSAARFEISASG